MKDQVPKQSSDKITAWKLQEANGQDMTPNSTKYSRKKKTQADKTCYVPIRTFQQRGQLQIDYQILTHKKTRNPSMKNRIKLVVVGQMGYTM